MIYKNTSVKRVIAKVFTDLDLQEGEHRIGDMIEWAGEALEKIGAFPSFINKVTGKDGSPILKVVNYQAPLPCDFHRMIQVSYGVTETGPFYPMRYATGSFDHGSILNTNMDNASSSDENPESSLITLTMSLYDLSYAAALLKLNDEPDIRSQLNSMLNQMDGAAVTTTDIIDTTFDYTYVITPGYIKTNQSAGYIMMAYQAIPTDNEGFPLIPDDASFFEALYWYITMKLMYPKWVQGSVRDGIYFDARRSWNYYCKQAYGNALMPNKDQLESIKNTWNRLVPELNEWNTGFSTLGQRQIIYNSN